MHARTDSNTGVALPRARDLYYGGRWHKAHGGYQDTFNPGNGENLGPSANADAEDVELAAQAAHAACVESGFVWINGSSAHFLGAPFGGYKQSGIGREESIHELLAFTQIKNINLTL
jgi:betaine-aldehyde dehydrogenase